MKKSNPQSWVTEGTEAQTEVTEQTIRGVILSGAKDLNFNSNAREILRFAQDDGEKGEDRVGNASLGFLCALGLGLCALCVSRFGSFDFSIGRSS